MLRLAQASLLSARLGPVWTNVRIRFDPRKPEICAFQHHFNGIAEKITGSEIPLIQCACQRVKHPIFTGLLEARDALST